MNKMLNRNIKIDFHIHSNASKHKENSEVVKESTEENLDILFGKLTEQGVNLFSFTDHNVFDKSLFLKAKQLIDSKMYPEILGIIPGIEFDTKLDEDANNYGHMLVLFDYKEESDLDRIVNVMEGKKININDYYDKETFEKILRDIGLSVIIFASQTRDPKNNSSKDDRSFNAQTVDQEMYIKIGYIDGFEFQKGRVQGMIQRYLRGINANEFPLITNSDCHDWKHYPYHDESQNGMKKNEEKFFTTIKCLPTFRGLLTAITSPETRIDRNLENDEEVKVIKEISIGGNAVKMSSGINVIIGDNGIGKTAILEILNSNHLNKKPITYYANFQSKNSIEISSDMKKSIKYLEQSGITKKRDKGVLLESVKAIGNVDTAHFETEVKKYGKSLETYLANNIEISNKIQQLNNMNLLFSGIENKIRTYFVQINNDLNTYDLSDPNDIYINELDEIIKKLNNHMKLIELYSADDLKKIESAIANLKSIYDKFLEKKLKLQSEAKIKNIIINHVKKYDAETHTKRSTEDKRLVEYGKQKQDAKNEILNLISSLNSDVKVDAYPCFDESYGKLEIPQNGFVFKKMTKFYGIETKNIFFETIFNKKFSSENEVLKIDSIAILSESVKGSSSDNLGEIFSKYNKNIEQFIDDMCKEKEEIYEASADDVVGTTPGQLAYVYLKFNFLENKDWDLLILDQPEENLSSQKISGDLIKYLNSIRNNKQIIIVTHTPLLVVNLDADNIIFLSKIDNKLNVKSGCLEYVNSDFDMLNIIANNIEGGAQSIRRRLRLYETQNYNNKE
jgi:predicted ATPase